MAPLLPKLTAQQHLTIVACYFPLITLLVSFMMSLILLSFSALPSYHFGQHWMLGWLACMVHLGALYVILLALGPKILPIVFMAYLTSNITAGFTEVEIEVMFYRVSYFFPFWHLISLNRFLYFGSYTRVYLHLPVVFAWFISSVILIPVLIRHNARKHDKRPQSSSILLTTSAAAGSGSSPDSTTITSEPQLLSSSSDEHMRDARDAHVPQVNNIATLAPLDSPAAVGQDSLHSHE